MFKDRATIYSLGYFPRGYTPEDFASGTQKPVMLNPRIGDDYDGHWEVKTNE